MKPGSPRDAGLAQPDRQLGIERLERGLGGAHERDGSSGRPSSTAHIASRSRFCSSSGSRAAASSSCSSRVSAAPSDARSVSP